MRRVLQLQHARGRGHVQPPNEAAGRGAMLRRRYHVDAVSPHPGVHVRSGHGHLFDAARTGRSGANAAARLSFDAGRGASGGGGGSGAARVGRRRSHRALAAQVPVVPRAAAQAAQPAESVAELGRHQVVQDGVQRRVYVQHDAAEEQQQIELLDADQRHDVVVGRRQDDPQDERAERQ